MSSLQSISVPEALPVFGQALALPGVPCRGDVFHALQEVTPVVSYLENRAYDTIKARSDLERKKAKSQRRGQRTHESQPLRAVQDHLLADQSILIVANRPT